MLVINSDTYGPGKGAIHISPSITVEEVFRLARIMSVRWKCTLENLSFGGSKAGIITEPKHISKYHRIELARVFSNAVRPLSPNQYVAAQTLTLAINKWVLSLGQWLPEILYGKNKEHLRQTGVKMLYAS